jgi:uncharacterized protein with GYD domain
MANRSKSSRPAPKRRQQHYLVQFSYTNAAWENLLKDYEHRDRVKAVEALVARLGGCIGRVTFPCEDPGVPREGKFGAFGDHDVVVLIAFPSDDAAASFAMAISAGGAVKSIKTTRILPWPEMMSAMAAAADSRASYVPPGKGR